MSYADETRFEFWPDGSLREIPGKDWREPLCSIRYVLDMMSFRYDPPGYSLAHARCVWTRRAFTEQAALAPLKSATQGDQEP